MSASMKQRAGRIDTTRFTRLLPAKVRAVKQRCTNHHWHPIESGWECCHGGHKLRARKNTCPPPSGTMDCAYPHEPESSLTSWLGTPAAELPLRTARVRRVRMS